ncbi:Na+/melibiose symporter-like transporter [Sediminihabitans luteus]|uniref:Na+/melibiose symporter-like transporter n=1 Tax=Sediminihabitans luteus TaxID=1138585 RepID=A0A2M9CY85_9CELL|nr:MFS transporter [Sediminihabitans luteus]PJJ76892.1 Na+/melibiose symporter-like transporter [Sediminihabitans luteus]GII99533.1 MFS transporter [Sediminihabitans luteus]
MNRPAQLRPGTVARYAVGSVGTGGFATLPGLVLIYYLTDALAVPALLAGTIVTVAKIWDVLVSPAVGQLSDADAARTGSRRRLMLAGGLTLPVFFALTFAVPRSLDPGAAGLWVLVAFLLTGTAFSLFQVPYIALPAEIAHTYDDRTRLLSWRVAILAVAILAFGAGGPLLRGESTDFAGYLRMGVVAGLVIGVGMVVAAGAAPRAPLTGTVAAARRPTVRGVREVVVASVRESAAALRRSQPFRTLFTTFALQALATGLMLAGAQYVATYVLDSEAAVSILFAALIAPALLTMPLWTRLAGRVGKERAFVVATVLFVVGAAAMLPLAWVPGVWVYATTALVGVAYAGMQALPLAMLPDVIQDDAERTGTATGADGGTFSGLWTAGETTGMALGGGLLSLVLAVTGFVSTTSGVDATQPGSAVLGISLAFSVLPATLAAVSIVPLVRYGLRRGHFEEARPMETP